MLICPNVNFFLRDEGVDLSLSMLDRDLNETVEHDKEGTEIEESGEYNSLFANCSTAELFVSKLSSQRTDSLYSSAFIGWKT
jgi:hypothetical protein